LQILAKAGTMTTIAGMDSLESRITLVEDEFSLDGDWNDRYRLLVEWGAADTPLAEDQRLPEWEVSGCSSPLWLKVGWTGDAVEVRGASPGLLPRALAALVVRLFDGLNDVTGATPALLDRLDLRRHLSPTRGLALERMLERVRTSCKAAP
jgi:cysteine desulfuration protein SufE